MATIDDEIIDSSFSAVINARIERVDIPAWCFSMSEKEYQGCSPAHIAAGSTTTPDGRRMSINVEMIGSLSKRRYIEKIDERNHLVLESASHILTPTGRKTINVFWELSVESPAGSQCEFTNHIRATATLVFRDFLDRQGIPCDVFGAQRAPMSIA